MSVSPAPKASSAARQSAAVQLQASCEFAEHFIGFSAPAEQARQASVDLGIEPMTPVGAALLTFLARMTKAHAAVEIGTGTGVSSLAIIEGMAPEGILTSIDSEPEHQQAARRVLASAGVPARRGRLIAGTALDVLPKLSDGAYDLVVIDGDPLETLEYVAQAARMLRSGGVMVVNHAFAGGGIADVSNEDDNTVIIREVLEAVQSMDEFEPLLLPVGDGLLLASRA